MTAYWKLSYKTTVCNFNSIYYCSSPIFAKFGPHNFTIHWLPTNQTVRASPSGGSQRRRLSTVSMVWSRTFTAPQQWSFIYSSFTNTCPFNWRYTVLPKMYQLSHHRRYSPKKYKSGQENATDIAVCLWVCYSNCDSHKINIIWVLLNKVDMHKMDCHECHKSKAKLLNVHKSINQQKNL